MPIPLGRPCTSLPPSRTSTAGAYPNRIQTGPFFRFTDSVLPLEQRALVDGRAVRARANPEPGVAAGRHDHRPGRERGRRRAAVTVLLRRWVRGRRGRSGRRRRRLLRARGAAELPGRDGDDRGDDADGDERAQEADAEAGARPGEPHGNELRLVGAGEAAVVLLDVQVPVEAEIVGVRAQESLDVRVSGQQLPAFLLERLEVAVANPDRLLDVGRREVALQAGLAQAPPDLEHAALSRTPARCANALTPVLASVSPRGPGR